MDALILAAALGLGVTAAVLTWVGVEALLGPVAQAERAVRAGAR